MALASLLKMKLQRLCLLSSSRLPGAPDPGYCGKVIAPDHTLHRHSASSSSSISEPYDPTRCSSRSNAIRDGFPIPDYAIPV